MHSWSACSWNTNYCRPTDETVATLSFVVNIKSVVTKFLTRLRHWSPMGKIINTIGLATIMLSLNQITILWPGDAGLWVEVIKRLKDFKSLRSVLDFRRSCHVIILSCLKAISGMYWQCFSPKGEHNHARKLRVIFIWPKRLESDRWSMVMNYEWTWMIDEIRVAELPTTSALEMSPRL